MTNKQICEELNNILNRLEINQREVKLNKNQYVIEKFVVVNGVEIKINTRLNTSKKWDRDVDKIEHIAFRKDKRRKLEEFLDIVGGLKDE